MEKLNFYSYSNSERFLKTKFQTICFLGACTAKNLALGIEYFSNNSIKAYAPYETVFNLPSMLNDLEIVSKKLDHKIIINSELEEFSDNIRFWNHSRDIKKVIVENKRIDSCIIEGIKNSDLVIVALGSVEMWKYSNQVMNRLPKNQFYNSEIENIYLNATDAQEIMQQIINCIQAINPLITIQFSIPYVLLKASERFSNLHLSTMENYRILKNAILSFGEEYYFPEYELFKFYLEKNSGDFQVDNRHPSVKLISSVTKHIVSELGKNDFQKLSKDRFSINKVNKTGKSYGKEYL